MSLKSFYNLLASSEAKHMTAIPLEAFSVLSTTSSKDRIRIAFTIGVVVWECFVGDFFFLTDKVELTDP